MPGESIQPAENLANLNTAAHHAETAKSHGSSLEAVGALQQAFSEGNAQQASPLDVMNPGQAAIIAYLENMQNVKLEMDGLFKIVENIKEAISAISSEFGSSASVNSIFSALSGPLLGSAPLSDIIINSDIPGAQASAELNSLAHDVAEAYPTQQQPVQDIGSAPSQDHGYGR
ncbi:MAG: hypothetical protein P857_195 [Candidatus Xenolissoclinum pacificiensis L6]|uniref:Uncharacterized protein n=1 Tax=Candidatus Xenolissoclinum pacificiensis L6 TaxID=1401685 RepID=W2V1K5_9RICK|nr:MAG: hypothetical protein P857_195 [Candidatus Xenolissoclinum pacificiensis L6]